MSAAIPGHLKEARLNHPKKSGDKISQERRKYQAWEKFKQEKPAELGWVKK